MGVDYWVTLGRLLGRMRGPCNFSVDLFVNTFFKFQRQGNLRTSMEIQKRISQYQSRTSHNQLPIHSQPRYPILNTAQIQQRSQENQETSTPKRPVTSRRKKMSEPPPLPPKLKPKAKLTNLYGVIDTNKLMSLCGDYDNTRYDGPSDLDLRLDPIPEASAPPYNENDESTTQYETTPNITQNSPQVPSDNPYKTHGKPDLRKPFH